ncbi:MAG: hypothetical protein UU08_C0001G0013 [Candidatus Uhrbacteria bacterium GW2011_GWE2_40_58]|nr:MAG: hypothetical protein UT94_C0001G0013 [Candidatus Uhrbacteria bacterium GW2011_GWF2_40_263]KKR68239.1 MAG: hypothetical protein UU08_C0001G0013 [Candidatus Uhrbacteria bacterium GW2011_GWE2_40_58]OGL92043.1 MAG: hypothetical protein A2239_03450 [Candidatus Uhrbacteria bacterium RIFOXYA2_FULL_40_9]OGL97500.1 MAG: hypothetical protein A2332_00155 [Candidatus Uhrbacteria bacterium RIFOXYB2_FULL_41_18]HBK35113.1 hypothetical protein [Candidatus Uhrbacteria bacterium]
MEPLALSNTVLLVLEKPPEALPEVLSPTAFEGFFAMVQELHLRPEVCTNRHSVRWEGHPAINDICSGLYLYAMRVAQDRQLPFHTEDQVYQVFLEIDSVIEVGLVSRYTSMQEAAEAYLHEVTEAVQQVIQVHGLRPGMKVPGAALKLLIQNKESHFFQQALRGQAIPEFGSWDSLWQFASALFFVKLEQAAFERINELNERTEHLYQRNGIRYRGRYLPLTSVVRTFPTLHNPLRNIVSLEKIGFPSLKSEQEIRTWLTGIETLLSACEQRIQAFRELPIRLEGMPKDVLEIERHGGAGYGPDTMAEGWLSTQMLFACLDKPVDRVYLLASEYVEALVHLQASSTDEVMIRFEARFQFLCPKVSVLTREQSLQYVRTRVEEARGWDCQIDVYMHVRAFISLPHDQLTISEEDALQLAMGEALDLELSTQVHLPKNEKLRETIFAAIVWSEVSLSEYRQMLVSEVLPSGLLARALSRIPQSERRPYLDLFLRSVELTNEVFQVFREDGVFVLDVHVVDEYASKIPPEELKKWLLECAERDEGVDEIRSIVRAFLCLEAGEVQTILCEPRVRAYWISTVIAEIWSERDADRYLSHSEYQAFLQKIGNELWRKMMLVLEVLEREVAYANECEVDEEDGDYRPPWKEMASESYDSFSFEESIGLHGEELQAFISSYTEQELLAWYYGDEPVEMFAKRLEAYCVHQEQYYQRLSPLP